MANDPVSPRPLPFNIPEGFDAIKARDAEFWRRHACWQLAEDDFKAWGGETDECPHGLLLFNRADDLRDIMLSMPVRTAAALTMKLDAVRQDGFGSIIADLPCGMTIAEVIAADVERLAKFEMFGTEAFQDMAEG